MVGDRSARCHQCIELLEWARARLTAPGIAELELPRASPSGGAAAGAAGLRLDDGRCFLLIRDRVGWKGNFTGILCFDGRLRDDQLIRGAVAPYVTLYSEQPFQELFVRSELGPNCFEVYFDLY